MEQIPVQTNNTVAFNSNQSQKKRINLSSHLTCNADSNNVIGSQANHIELETLDLKKKKTNLKRWQIDEPDFNSRKKRQRLRTKLK